MISAKDALATFAKGGEHWLQRLVKEGKDVDGSPRLSQGQLSDCAARIRPLPLNVGLGAP